MALKVVLWVGVVVVGVIVSEVIRGGLGTEVKHQDHGRAVVYYIATWVIIILAWEAFIGLLWV